MSEATTFILIRHGLTDAVGRRMAGRLPGFPLNSAGVAQVEALARRLSGAPVHAIYSSPLERTVQTATPLARVLNLEVQTRAGLNELDFGDWSGRTLEELDQYPLWKAFHVFRAGVRIPGGELMIELQARAAAELEQLRRRHPAQTIVLVTHSDVIRGALASYLGLPCELLTRIEISPASLTVLRVGQWGPQLVRLNDTGEALP